MRIGDLACVVVDGEIYAGVIYHIRENGWPCIKSPDGHIASGPTMARVAEVPSGDFSALTSGCDPGRN